MQNFIPYEDTYDEICRMTTKLTRKILLTFAMLLFSMGLSYGAKGFTTGFPGSGLVSWIDSSFSKGTLPPFSFEMDGIPSSVFIKKWDCKRIVVDTGSPDTVERIFIYTDPSNGLEIECRIKGYPGYDALEWMFSISNHSDCNSPRLTSFKVADIGFRSRKPSVYKMHYAEGNKISKADYSPRELTFEAGVPLRAVPADGRSSSEAFPFFCLENETSSRGAIIAIGWTGTWFYEIEKTSPKSLSLELGQLNFDLYLRPGEEIRTPSVAMLFWTGDRLEGHNRFRRFVIEHRSRTIDGKVDYPLCSGFNYRDPQPFGEYSAITEKWAVAMIERYAQFGLLPDVFWLDAGWHTGASDYRNGLSWANTTGNWTVDSSRFPRGMKPISDAAHRHGAKFMLWFEPERVVRGTQWSVEHPDWMLEADWPEGSEESTWQLLDLSDDAAAGWLMKYYGDMIEENGVDYYRQDCNVKPAKYWAAKDEPGRRGMTEIRYVTNLYRFWDYLLDRFPGLLIDNCASGGKRLDWETIGRSAPLWRSDYYHYDDPDGYQCHTYGLNMFLPIHGTGILLPDKYSFRSSLSSTLIFNWKITEAGLDYREMQARIGEYRDIKPYYYEDYYPLSGAGDLTRDDVWLAYELRRPSDDTGVVLAFRRAGCPDEEYTVRLHGLDASSRYELTDADNGTLVVVEGSVLMGEGYTFRLPEPRSSALLRFRKTND